MKSFLQILNEENEVLFKGNYNDPRKVKKQHKDSNVVIFHDDSDNTDPEYHKKHMTIALENAGKYSGINGQYHGYMSKYHHHAAIHAKLKYPNSEKISKSHDDSKNQYKSDANHYSNNLDRILNKKRNFNESDENNNKEFHSNQANSKFREMREHKENMMDAYSQGKRSLGDDHLESYHNARKEHEYHKSKI